MESTPLFLIAMSIGLAIGLLGSQRRIAQRVRRNLGEFLDKRGGSITDSDGQQVPADELVHNLLMPRIKRNRTKVIVIYSVFFGVAVLATIAFMLLTAS